MSSVSGATQARAFRLESSCSRLNVSRAHRRTSAAPRRASDRDAAVLPAGRAGAPAAGGIVSGDWDGCSDMVGTCIGLTAHAISLRGLPERIRRAAAEQLAQQPAQPLGRQLADQLPAL